MITGKTSSGFEFSVDEKITNDFRFVMMARKTMSKDKETSSMAGVDMVEFLLGEDQLVRLEQHVQDDSGHVPTDSIMAEFREIMDSCMGANKEIKN